MSKERVFLRYSTLAAVVLFCLVWLPATFARAEIPKDELVIATPSEIETLDPAQHMSNGSKKGENLVYNGLIGYKAESAEIVPDLAESWTMSPDGLTVTFKLRKGVKFHDGTPFTAEAVKFSWDRMLKADLSAAGKYKTYADFNSVKVIDDYTVSFIPTAPRSQHDALVCRRAEVLHRQSHLCAGPCHG